MSEVPQGGREPTPPAPDSRPGSPFARLGRRCAGYLDRMTLNSRVVLLVVLLLVAGIWGLALSVTLALEREITQALAADYSADVANIADDLDRDVRLYTDVLGRLAASITPEIQADPVRLERTLDHFAETSAIVPYASLVANGKGIIIAGYPEYAVQAGASIGDRGYFRRLIAGGKPVVGEPAPGAKATHEKSIPIAVPLRDRSGATAGALVGSILLSDPLSFGQLDKVTIGQNGWILVVSPRDRRILAATDQRRVLNALPARGVIPLLDRRLDEGYAGPGVTVGSNGIEVLSVSRKMATTGWVVIGSVPTAEAYASIASIKQRIYLAALLISLMMAAILRYFLARQFAPLKEAGSAMRRMTAGEIAMTALPVVRHDEIGELIASFNQLAAERSRLDQSLLAEILQRNQANEALRESKDRLDGIYQSVGDGIISIDARQQIVMFNAAAERIFGYPAAAMIGQHLNMLMPERFRAGHGKHIQKFDALGQSRRGMGTYGLIYGRRASGEEFPIEAAVSQSGTAPDKLFTVILRDVTERRRAEQVREHLTLQLERLSERLGTAHEEERRKVAYALHEELGQELATLKFYLQMAAPGSSGAAARAPHDEALAVTVHATERIRRLVLDLEPPELATFGLVAAVRAYCQRQAAAGGWKLHVDAEAPELRAPQPVERACFRVLQEGLSNVLSHAHASEVWVRVRQDAGELELSLRDNGIGFEYDAAREEQGTEPGRLGLFGMQVRARQVGGSVTIKSRAGAGTEVLAVFPLSVATAHSV